MQHRVAVGTHWHQIASRVHSIHVAACGYRTNVVNVNEPLPDIAILVAKQQVADGAPIAKESDAVATGSGITFVRIDDDLLSSSLLIGVWLV
jgi:hypothetical protein